MAGSSAWITDASNLCTKNLPPIDAFRNTNPLLLEVKETNILQNVYCLSEEEKAISYLPGEESGDSDSDWKTANSVLLTYLVTQSSLWHNYIYCRDIMKIAVKNWRYDLVATFK